MCADQFSSAVTKLLGSEVRTAVLAVVAERPDDWLTAAQLCDLAGVSRSGFHRDHKDVLLDFDLLQRREADESERDYPEYALADSDQAALVADLHEALEAEREQSGSQLASSIEGFTR